MNEKPLTLDAYRALVARVADGLPELRWRIHADCEGLMLGKKCTCGTDAHNAALDAIVTDARRLLSGACPDCGRPVKRVAGGEDAIVPGTTQSKDPSVCMQVGPNGWTVDCNAHNPNFVEEARRLLGREVGTGASDERRET